AMMPVIDVGTGSPGLPRSRVRARSSGSRACSTMYRVRSSTVDLATPAWIGVIHSSTGWQVRHGSRRTANSSGSALSIVGIRRGSAFGQVSRCARRDRRIFATTYPPLAGSSPLNLGSRYTVSSVQRGAPGRSVVAAASTAAVNDRCLSPSRTFRSSTGLSMSGPRELVEAGAGATGGATLRPDPQQQAALDQHLRPRVHVVTGVAGAARHLPQTVRLP